MNAQIELIEKDFDKVLVAGSIKAAMKDTGSGSRDLWQVPIGQLRVITGLNPRVMNQAYEEHIRSLADSMLSEGFFQDQPLAGYVEKEGESNTIFVYSGHSRLAAAKLANMEGAQIERLPVVVSTQGLSIEDLTVALVRGNGGKSLTYFESAIVCKRLVRYGMELDEIARRTGITVPLVKNRLQLMAAPAPLRELVANEKVSATLAIELLAKHGDKVMDAVKSAIEVAGNEGKTKVRKAQTAQPDVINRAKVVKKAAPKLFEAADQVFKDPGFSGLSQDTRNLLESLLTEIKSTGSDQSKVDSDQPATEIQS